ncbi:phosphoadenosine phosphosulfate reductase [Escherichia coli]|nr:phosphoadenosine phosphosulfate reductase [Escherichia coli]
MSYPVQKKIKTGENVLRAAVERINWVFDTFAEICLSFSGGKDSTVLFHLVADIARRKKRRFSVLFIDWEAQYLCTVRHVQKMRELYMDVTESFYWVALPLTTVNGVSQFQPGTDGHSVGRTEDNLVVMIFQCSAVHGFTCLYNTVSSQCRD